MRGTAMRIHGAHVVIPEQAPRLDLEGPRDPRRLIDGHRVLPLLPAAHSVPGDVQSVSKLLLRETTLTTDSPDPVAHQPPPAL